MPRFLTRFRVATLIVVLSATSMMALSAASAGRESDAFTPIAGWDKQLFPSFLIATATARLSDENTDEDAHLLGDRQGVLGVKLTSPGDDVPVTVTISSATILEPSTFSGTLESKDATYEIYPSIKYKYGVLAKNKQSVPATVTFRVKVGDEEATEQTATMTVRSVNDCPFTIADGDGSFVDVSYVFAAYVNEQHPFVDKMLREALDRGVVDSFTGYQSGDPAEVYRQVFALWDALSERDVRYSNITASAAESETVDSQHVRLLDESINNAQANCVDGSVLLASLLRKIDIEPVLVFVPGHCYLAFYLDAEGKHLVGLETTLIGSEGDDSTRDIDGVKDIVDADVRKENSWATFCAAIAAGNKDLKDNEAKFADKENPDFQLIPIAEARKQGILPIAFDSANKFESVPSED